MLERITDTVDSYVRAYPEQLTVMLECITERHNFNERHLENMDIT